MTKYLLVRGLGGLGNRILGLLAAIPFARLAGRELVVQWCDPNYSDDETNVVHQYFKSKWLNPSAEIPQTDSVYPAFWRKPLAGPQRLWVRPLFPELVGHPHSWWYLSADPKRLDYDEQVVVFLSSYPVLNRMHRHLKGEYEPLRKLDQKSAFRQLYRENLELAPSIREQVDQIRAGWPRRPVIGVHARYTDRKVNLSAVHRHVRQILTSQPDAAIFLATDNREILNQFSATYPAVLTAERSYAPDGAPLHRTPGFAGAAQRGVEALVDIYLLASADYLVVDEGSTFSYLASILSDQPPSRIHNIQSGGWLPDRIRHGTWSVLMDVKYLPKTLRHLRRRWRERSDG